MLRRDRVVRCSVGCRLVVLSAIGSALVGLGPMPWSADGSRAGESQGTGVQVKPKEAGALTSLPTNVKVKSPDATGSEGTKMTEARPITGVVIGPDGAPVPGARVYLRVDRISHPLVAGELDVGALPKGQWKHLDFNWRFRATRWARTDAAGRFTIAVEPTGPEYYAPYLLVMAEGFGIGSIGLRLTEDNGVFAYQGWQQPAGGVRVQLPEMTPIRGQLLKPDGTPAVGVLVRVRFITSRDDILKECHCRFMLPWELAAAPFPATSSRRLLQGNGDRFQAEWPQPVSTDAEGWFTLKGIPAGANAYLNLFPPEFPTESLIVETRPGEFHDIWRFITLVPPRPPSMQYEPPHVGPTFTYTLSPACPVEGSVTAADSGKPLANVVVTVLDSKGYPAPGGTYTLTDPEGRYRVSRHRDKYYSLTFYPPPDSGYLVASASAEGGQEGAQSVTANVRLKRGGIIRGQVVEADTGRPIWGASVIYLRRDPSAVFEHRTNPALTDQQGRFAVTGRRGPGCLSVETPNRCYRRSADVHTILKDRDNSWPLSPMHLIPIEVPSKGDLENVVIRLQRGRTAVIQAMGPNGERLPWVQAVWEGIETSHGSDGSMKVGFAQGKVAVRDLDGNRIRRILMLYEPRKLGAAFDVLPEIGEEPVEVRLQPMGAIVGQIVTPDDKPAQYADVRLMMSLDPNVTRFGPNHSRSSQYDEYQVHVLNSRLFDGRADGQFTFECVVAGIPLGLQLSGPTWSPGDLIPVEPLKPGERRDVGKLVIREQPVKPRSRGLLDRLFRGGSSKADRRE